MAKRDILKEAIADAKAVKEVAIANAKAALEEAFTPKLKSMLSAKIAEMDEADDTPINEYDRDFVEFCKRNPQDPQCPGSSWNEGKEKKSLFSTLTMNVLMTASESTSLDVSV